MKEVLEELLTEQPKADYTLGVRITDELRMKLEKLSEKTGKSKSVVVKAILEAGLKEIEL